MTTNARAGIGQGRGSRPDASVRGDETRREPLQLSTFDDTEQSNEREIASARCNCPGSLLRLVDV